MTYKRGASTRKPTILKASGIKRIIVPLLESYSGKPENYENEMSELKIEFLPDSVYHFRYLSRNAKTFSRFWGVEKAGPP